VGKKMQDWKMHMKIKTINVTECSGSQATSEVTCKHLFAAK